MSTIATDVPGCHGAIAPEKTDLLVPPQNAEALADVIRKLVEDPELRQQMGAAGRKLAEDAFAIEKIVEQHMHIYAELLAND